MVGARCNEVEQAQVTTHITPALLSPNFFYLSLFIMCEIL